jgi:3-dehydroquinate dehydratase type I
MKICVPIQAKYQKAVIKRLQEASKKADLAEVWLDQIEDLDIKSLLKNSPLPLVCVCKKAKDKGKFKGSFEALSKILIAAIKHGADYVDIPIEMPEKLNKKIVQEARKKKCKIIISHHDFKATPDYPKLVKIADSIKKRGAGIIKMATYANRLEDTVNIIALGKYLEGIKTPHILIGMGQKGILTRILTPTLGGELMFASLKGKTTAPGQISVADLKKAWKLLK